MKASEIFGLIVRSTGFLTVVYSLWNLLTGVDYFFENVLQLSQDSDNGATFSCFVLGMPGLVFGLLLFFLADAVVRLAYRDHSR
jgi:hypothetical protein